MKLIKSLAGARWYAPWRPGRGFPRIGFPTGPLAGAHCHSAFTTRGKCATAILKYFHHCAIIVVDDPAAWNAAKQARGYRVLVDLFDDGERWSWREFDRAGLLVACP